MGRTTAAVARKSRQFAIPPLVSIYIHCWDWSSKAFQGFTGDSPFFAASKLGLEAHFCTLEMGLIDRSIDCSVKRCRPAWSIRMIRRCLKWSGAPLCSGICCDNRVGRSPPKSPMPPLRNSEFHDQRCFAQLLAFVGRVGLRAFFRSSAEREMGVCYLIRGSNASSKSK
jgi:hypothetical protein